MIVNNNICNRCQFIWKLLPPGKDNIVHGLGALVSPIL